MLSLATYLNALKDVNIVAIYALHSLIEIVYEDALGRNRSVTFNFRVSGGSMGYVESFQCDSIPLPPAKSVHPLSGVIKRLFFVNFYATSEEYFHTEELEFVCEEGRYLFYFDSNDDDMFCKIEKDKAPSLSKVEYAKEALFPQELFSVEDFKTNLAFALQAHGEQKTPHGLPYSMHLLSVAAEVISALSVEPLSYDENNVAIACALLHDVNEDTAFEVSKESPIAGHKEVIAKGVRALTKDKTLWTKKAQMEDSLKRLKERQNCVAMVKLADRITNLGTPPSHWDTAKKKAYVEEARRILEELGDSHTVLARKLEEKIKAYTLYM